MYTDNSVETFGSKGKQKNEEMAGEECWVKGGLFQKILIVSRATINTCYYFH